MVLIPWLYQLVSFQGSKSLVSNFVFVWSIANSQVSGSPSQPNFKARAFGQRINHLDPKSLPSLDRVSNGEEYGKTKDYFNNIITRKDLLNESRERSRYGDAFAQRSQSSNKFDSQSFNNGHSGNHSYVSKNQDGKVIYMRRFNKQKANRDHMASPYNHETRSSMSLKSKVLSQANVRRFNENPDQVIQNNLMSQKSKSAVKSLTNNNLKIESKKHSMVNS